MITVLMPAFRAGGTIRSAVRSTLRALPGDGVLLVADDGSDDDTLEVLGRESDHRLTVVAGTENQGISPRLNQLLAMVETPLVARLDADDMCLPWRFRAQQQLMAKGVDVVFTTVVPLRDNRPMRPNVPFPITPDAFNLHLLLDNPVAHSTMLARTADLRRLGGYHDMPAEDYELWLRMAHDGLRLSRGAIPGVAYRFHGQQVTAAADWHTHANKHENLRAAFSELSLTLLGTSLTGPEDPARLDLLWAASDRIHAVQRGFLRAKIGSARAANAV